MREIKFRAWYEGDEEMLYADNHWLAAQMFAQRHDEDFPIMQFTGLHDKNGKEIYEGDILRVWHCDYEDEPAVGKVAWYDCYYPAFDIYVKSDTHKTGFESYSDEWNSFSCPDYVFEVIGNIYENPELLEGEE